MHYPGSSPSRMQTGFVVDGNAGPIFAGCPYELATAEAYATESDVINESLQIISLAPAEGWRGLPTDGPRPLTTSIPVTTKDEAPRQTWQLAMLGGPKGYDRVVVCREKDLATVVGESKLNQWSEWAFVPFGERQGTVRFKLTGLSPDGKHLKLYRSQIMPTDGFSEPDDIVGELVDKIGPYQEHVSQVFDVLGIVDYDTCVEEADYQGEWLAKAALYLTKEKGCDIFFCHWHFLDDVNHYHLAHLDPFFYRYDPKEAPKHWDMVRQAYQSIDRMVGTLLEGVTDDDYVIMVSDHGCSPVNRMVHMEQFLYDKDFLVFKDPRTPKTALAKNWYDRIDWEKSKVWLHEGVFLDMFNVFINAEAGSEKYKEIQRDLIRELRAWIDPETEQTVFALVLAKRDAELIGLWGDQLGDVVVVLEAGYQMAKKEGPAALEYNTGQLASGHARMLPTEESVYGTQKAMFTVAGPGIKKGYERPAQKLGHIKLIDVAPTIAYLMGVEPPLQCQGTVIQDMLEGREVVRERPAQTPYYAPTKHFKQWLQRFFNEREVMAEDVVPC